jgi:hypothetical protein
MASLPDLSLPATIPEMAVYHDREASDGPFAIYALCVLTKAILRKLRELVIWPAWRRVKEDSLDSMVPNDEDDDDGDAGRNEDFGKAPGIGYHIGVYVRGDLDSRALLREIEPAVDVKQPSEVVCKVLRAVPARKEARGDLVARWQSRQRVDSIAVGTHVGEARDWASEFVFPIIAGKGGLVKWRPKHILFGVYSLPYLGRDIKFQSAIDPKWDTRGSGQDRMFYAGSIEGAEELDTFQVYRKLIQTHLGFCGGFRFAPNLCTGDFVFCDTKQLKDEGEVMVVKVGDA